MYRISISQFDTTGERFFVKLVAEAAPEKTGAEMPSAQSG
jgi:hypothetical protein